jgi:hypothetical protein
VETRNNKRGDGLNIYHRLRRWGATDAEVLMSLPGDNVAPKANYQNTLAITIDAPPVQIWPWVVQMGQERAGFYTYTFLENLFFADMHNANPIEPEWQQRKVGDFVSTFRGKLGWKVAEIEINRSIVYRDDNNTSTLAVVINKLDNNHSRLITRMRDTTGNNPGIWLFKKMFWDWAHCVMQHGILKGIKTRVGQRQSIT